MDTKSLANFTAGTGIFLFPHRVQTGWGAVPFLSAVLLHLSLLNILLLQMLLVTMLLLYMSLVNIFMLSMSMGNLCSSRECSPGCIYVSDEYASVVGIHKTCISCECPLRLYFWCRCASWRTTSASGAPVWSAGNCGKTLSFPLPKLQYFTTRRHRFNSYGSVPR
jgi:hypothetical protein